MDFSTIKDLYIGSTPVQSAYLNGAKIWGRKLPVDEAAILNSMVLWYDPKRQGATNESMAANPVLRDLSGNGHDATCYNFAWSGESGIGSYTQNKFSNSTYRKVISATGWAELSSSYNPNVSWKIKVSCADKPITLEDNVRLFCPDLSNNTELASLSKPLEDGKITTITPYTGTENVTMLYIDLNSQKGHEVIVEQIPEYPNALVADGVDDYAMVEGVPLMDDYTIIWNAENTGETVYGVLGFSKRSNESDNRVDGAFCFGKCSGYNDSLKIFNYSYTNIIDNINSGINYVTKESFNGTHPLTAGTASDSSIFRIFNLWTNEITKGALYSVILFNRTLTTEEIEWVKENLIASNEEEVDWYGVEFYTTSPYPDCIRIGNPELHKTLPVHTQMKGVLLSDDGTVNKYLNESDWTSETRDGSQGQVMVEMPKEGYWKFETDGNIRRVKFSTKPLPGFQRTPQGYVSAYEAALQRSTNTLCSVVNTDVDYRGGNNNAEWDGTYRSLLGMPATSINRTNFRNYARKRNNSATAEWNCMTFDAQKTLYWLFVVEFATLNTQAPYNAQLTAEGYRQGGLGEGVTTVGSAIGSDKEHNGETTESWAVFNGQYPWVPCGTTDTLGNGTGQVEYSQQDTDTGAWLDQFVPRYRGIENPFGHIYQWTDGINVRINPAATNGGNDKSEVFVCEDPAKFSDSGYEGYSLVGLEARNESYVKEVIFGEGGEIMPSVCSGAGSTTYHCDYHYTNIPTTTTLRGVRFGGNSNSGASAGLVCAISGNAPSDAATFLGSRLCFIPNNNNN